MSDPSTTSLREIDIGLIDPNPWNPNEMPEENSAALVVETLRLQRNPKPIVVRLIGDRFQIVDGEHCWRAAKKAGLSKVLCEVIDVDALEAMRQTFARNQHGTHNKVLEGRMFQRMLGQMKKPTNRQLAKEVGTSEGNVRNSLDFAEAADVRTACAPETAVQDISELPLDKVHAYMALPAVARDRWLDQGAGMGHLHPFLKYGVSFLAEFIHSQHMPECLAKHIGRPGENFGVSLRRVVELYHQHGARAVEYTEPIAALGLPAVLAHSIPTRKDGRIVHFLITPPAWKNILETAVAHTKDQAGLFAEVQAGVRTALREAGHDPAALMSNQDQEALQLMPEFLREAIFLSLEEQLQIFQDPPPVAQSLVEAIQQRAVELLADSRLKGRAKSRRAKLSVTDALVEARREITAPNPVTSPAKNHAESLTDILKEVASTVTEGTALPMTRSLAEILQERLAAIPEPEHQLVTLALMTHPVPATVLTVWAQKIARAESQPG